MVALSGDENADTNAIAKSWRAYEEKLIIFAKHFVVPLDTPDDVLALTRTLLPAANQFCGFQPRVVKRAGRKKKKTPSYLYGLALAYEATCLWESGITQAAFAERYAEHCVRLQNNGRLTHAGKQQARKDASQFQNTLSETPGTLRDGAHFIAKTVIEDGMTADEIERRLGWITKNTEGLFHKNE